MATTSRFSTRCSRLLARPIKCSRRSSTTRASSSSRSPAGVSTGFRPALLNKATPRSVSRFATWVLTADCALRSTRAAPEKEPASAAATKAWSWSSETAIYLILRCVLTCRTRYGR
ncbi:hypothetical protein ASF26_14800 [Methylobacterium sp. Leaf93]|nr:hypothetical protein ASF26_14800 [Methylobacterium sp. Leaf93]